MMLPDAFTRRISVWCLQMKGDLRLIRTRAFASELSLRFPVVTHVRFDKCATDVDDVQSLTGFAASGAHGLLCSLKITSTCWLRWPNYIAVSCSTGTMI